MKTYSLEQIKDELIGKVGTDRRNAYENELCMDNISAKIRELREEKHLSQSELGERVGVGKAQISKIENSASNSRLDTIVKIFSALGAKIKFEIETDNLQNA